jgi:hypothetical protein
MRTVDVDRHAARVAVAIFRAVNERKELLPYMKKLLMRNIILNIDKLTEQEIDLYLASSRFRNLLDEEDQKGQV